MGCGASKATIERSDHQSFHNMAGDKDDIVYQAKLAEQAERYDEMVIAMKTVAKTARELSVEELDLLYVAYKNVIDARRNSWRTVSSLEQIDEGESAGTIQIIKDYRLRMETELRSFCHEILGVIIDHLIPNSTCGDSKALHLKMKGDFHRYLAEFAMGTDREEAVKNCLTAYKAASDIALADLAPRHPIRLALALNFSVFYNDILNDTEKAIRLAQEELDKAAAGFDTLNVESSEDSTGIMLCLQDNLSLWTSNMQGGTEGGEQ